MFSSFGDVKDMLNPNPDKEELALKVLKNEIRHLGFDPDDVCILRYINKT